MERNNRNINAPGLSYFFVLTVLDETRESAPVIITVNINPSTSTCVGLDVDDIQNDSLILRSDLEFAFIKVNVRDYCNSISLEELTWEALDI